MAANITATQFLELFDEFSKIPVTKINAYLNIATTRVPLNIWGDNTNYATALLTAHMLTAQGRHGLGSGGGAVSAEAVGDLSRAFATVFDPTSGDALLRTTRYGLDFVALRMETIVSGMTTSRGVPPRPWGGCW